MVTGVLRRVTGFSDVMEKDGEIIISGISAENLARDMRTIWTTSKVAGAMFTKVTWTNIRIPSFFGLELHYILTKLLSFRKLNTSKRIIKNIIDGLETNTWIANIERKVEPWLDRNAFKNAFIFKDLLPHQHRFLDRYEEIKPKYGLNGMLLAAAAGSGKSITGCALALAVHADIVIIICPKNSVKRVWMKTLNEEFKVPQNPYVAEIDGDIQPKKRWHIFHYETLDRALQLAKTVTGKNVVIILDESHNFNDSKSLRTDRFLQLCKVSGAKNIVWASGTPVKAIGFETIPLLKSIDPLFDQRAEEGFRKMYGRDAKRTLDILSYRLGLVTYHVAKDEVMDDKPIIKSVKVQMPHGDKYTLTNLSKLMDAFIKERTEFYQKNKTQYIKNYNHCVELYQKTIKTEEQRNEFMIYKQTVAWLVKNGFDSRTDGAKAVLTNKFEKEKINPILTPELKKIFKDAKSVVKYVDLKIRGECLGRILTRERVQCHVDMLKHINFKELINSVDKKTIVFTSYVKVVDACGELLSKSGFKPLKVYGETNNELANIVQKFDKDATINPLIATFMSLSTAVPLTMANGIIFLNSPWRSYERDQAIARAHRIGQDKPVTVYEIVLDTGKQANISSRSLDIMEWSKEQVDKIMGFQGDVNVSLECNGFLVDRSLDPNECIEDVLFDPEHTEYVDQLTMETPTVSQETFHYPKEFLYYR